jgi:hypothetical protein
MHNVLFRDLDINIKQRRGSKKREPKTKTHGRRRREDLFTGLIYCFTGQTAGRKPFLGLLEERREGRFVVLDWERESQQRSLLLPRAVANGRGPVASATTSHSITAFL